jgi:hypothetical protein
MQLYRCARQDLRLVGYRQHRDKKSFSKTIAIFVTLITVGREAPS